LDDLVPAIIQNIPRLIEQVQQQSTTRNKLEDDYYTMWPALKDNDGKAVTARLLPAYLQANPSATVEQAMREVGIAAMTSLQRPIQVPSSNSSTPPPSAPPAAGYTPASPGGAGGVPGGAKLGEWERMAEDLLQED
jgi:hypothetical protein